jgi:hypothetical protein
MKKLKIYESFGGKCTEFKPPKRVDWGKPSIFLAGSIEQGIAEDWQSKFVRMLDGHDVLVCNPRRDKWDASLEQDITNAEFSGQVNWELDALERCDVVAMYLDPETKSPISLLELGLYAQSGKLLVCCPDGFHRKGNVDVTCARYGVPTYSTLDELVGATITKISQLCH